MAKDYRSRLEALRDRRLGPQIFGFGEALGQRTVTASVRKTEAYETRKAPESAKYALGAMQAVDEEYVKDTYTEGERVMSHLKDGLANFGISIAFEYQGSVPLNIQIKGVSDLDILSLHGGYFTYDSSGVAGSGYSAISGRKTIIDHMVELRLFSEGTLKNSFPSATVETGKAKAIHLSGGSLRREIDVVPSHWHNTSAYQRTGQKHDREVCVLDKHKKITISNSPFLYMLRVNQKDTESSGGAKKVIRFLKTIRNDATPKISLSSYDIASLVYHFNSHEMKVPPYLELGLVAVARDRLFDYASNEALARSLDTPDSSRKIIDTDEKFSALQRLAVDVDEVASDIARELSQSSVFGINAIRTTLQKAQIY